MNLTQKNTKERIIDVALDFFTRKGFSGVSVREIVEKAGVSKPTLYYYFTNKEDLYLSLIRNSFLHFNEQLLAITALPADNLRDKLLDITSHYLDFCRKFPREIKLSLMSIYRTETSAPRVDMARFARPAIAAIADVIGRGIKRGEIKEADPVRLALQLLGMIHIQFLIALQQVDFPLPLSGAKELVETFLTGIESR